MSGGRRGQNTRESDGVHVQAGDADGVEDHRLRYPPRHITEPFHVSNFSPFFYGFEDDDQGNLMKKSKERPTVTSPLHLDMFRRPRCLLNLATNNTSIL